LKEKYLKNLVNENFSKSSEERFIRFINFKQLCHELIGDECISEGERLRNTKLTDTVTGKMTMTFTELQEYFKKNRAAREASRQNGYIQAAMEDNDFDALFEKNVKGTLNQIISSLSSKSNCYNILLIDEVPSGVEHEWSDLVVADNVDWIMAVSPGGYTNCGNDFYDIKPPSSSNTTLTKKLLRRYRNCKEIRNFHNFWLEHGKFGHMSLSEEKFADDALLPSGELPLWIEVTTRIGDKEALEIIASKYTAGMSVTLTYPMPILPKQAKKMDDSDTLADHCKAHGWSYMKDINAQGTEDECFIIIRRPWSPIYPEHLSRARKLLIIVTTELAGMPGLWNVLKNCLAHQSPEYSCKLPNCKYIGQTLFRKSNVDSAWICDECGSMTAMLRFRCLECEDFDLCEECKTSEIHDHHELRAFKMEGNHKVVENHVITPEEIFIYDAVELGKLSSILTQFGDM